MAIICLISSKNHLKLRSEQRRLSLFETGSCYTGLQNIRFIGVSQKAQLRINFPTASARKAKASNLKDFSHELGLGQLCCKENSYSSC